MNVFFHPFVSECIALDRDSFACSVSGNVTNVNLSVLVGVSDAVARPLIQNFKQFNGFH